MPCKQCLGESLSSRLVLLSISNYYVNVLLKGNYIVIQVAYIET